MPNSLFSPLPVPFVHVWLPNTPLAHPAPVGLLAKKGLAQATGHMMEELADYQHPESMNNTRPSCGQELQTVNTHPSGLSDSIITDCPRAYRRNQLKQRLNRVLPTHITFVVDPNSCEWAPQYNDVDTLLMNV